MDACIGCFEGRSKSDELRWLTYIGTFLPEYQQLRGQKVFLSEPGIGLLVTCNDHKSVADL